MLQRYIFCAQSGIIEGNNYHPNYMKMILVGWLWHRDFYYLCHFVCYIYHMGGKPWKNPQKAGWWKKHEHCSKPLLGDTWPGDDTILYVLETLRIIMLHKPEIPFLTRQYKGTMLRFWTLLKWGFNHGVVEDGVMFAANGWTCGLIFLSLRGEQLLGTKGLLRHNIWNP